VRCPVLANHWVPVMTSHLLSGKPETVEGVVNSDV
jgi:hypothetical protein